MYIIPIFIPHAGCRHTCTFCNQAAISGTEVAGMDFVRAQFEDFIKHLPEKEDKEIAFYGGSFTALEEDFQINLLKYAQSNFDKYKIKSVRISTRPDCIDERTLRILKSYSVTTIELGVQSLDNLVLELTQRGHDKSVVEPSVKLIKSFGIKVGIQLMIGMPGQTIESVNNTANDVVAMRPDLVRIYSLMVIKNTVLEKSFINGDFIPLELQTSVEWAYCIWDKMQQANIPVVRMGLQDTDSLKEQIVAGAYHPAFGELVVQYHYKLELESKIEQIKEREISIKYPPNLASKIIGERKKNKNYIADKFRDKKFFWGIDYTLKELKVFGRLAD